MPRVIIPGGTKFDVLCSTVVREYSLQAFVELLGKSCNVFRGIEVRFPQPFWLWLSEGYIE